MKLSRTRPSLSTCSSQGGTTRHGGKAKSPRNPSKAALPTLAGCVTPLLGPATAKAAEIASLDSNSEAMQLPADVPGILTECTAQPFFRDVLRLMDVTPAPTAAPDLSSLLTGNPYLFLGGVVLLLLAPAGVNWLITQRLPEAKIRVTPPAVALEALGENPKVILVDIRNKAEVKAQGTVDLRGVRRKAIQLPYTKMVKGEAVAAKSFGQRFYKLGGLQKDTRVLLLDAYGTQAVGAAKQILEMKGAVSQLYVIEGGMQGAGGWKECDLPWRKPGKGMAVPTLDWTKLGAVVDTLGQNFQPPPQLKAGLAAGALAGAGLLLVNEFGLALEVLGLLAAGQFAWRWLVAGREDKEQTLTEIRSLVNSKLAAASGSSTQIKQLASALLEDSSSSELRKLGAVLMETVGTNEPGGTDGTAAPPASQGPAGAGGGTMPRQSVPLAAAGGGGGGWREASPSRPGKAGGGRGESSGVQATGGEGGDNWALQAVMQGVMGLFGGGGEAGGGRPKGEEAGVGMFAANPKAKAAGEGGPAPAPSPLAAAPPTPKGVPAPSQSQPQRSQRNTPASTAAASPTSTPPPPAAPLGRGQEPGWATPPGSNGLGPATKPPPFDFEAWAAAELPEWSSSDAAGGGVPPSGWRDGAARAARPALGYTADPQDFLQGWQEGEGGGNASRPEGASAPRGSRPGGEMPPGFEPGSQQGGASPWRGAAPSPGTGYEPYDGVAGAGKGYPGSGSYGRAGGPGSNGYRGAEPWEDPAAWSLQGWQEGGLYRQYGGRPMERYSWAEEGGDGVEGYGRRLPPPGANGFVPRSRPAASDSWRDEELPPGAERPLRRPDSAAAGWAPRGTYPTTGDAAGIYGARDPGYFQYDPYPPSGRGAGSPSSPPPPSSARPPLADSAEWGAELANCTLEQSAPPPEQWGPDAGERSWGAADMVLQGGAPPPGKNVGKQQSAAPAVISPVEDSEIESRESFPPEGAAPAATAGPSAAPSASQRQLTPQSAELAATASPAAGKEAGGGRDGGPSLPQFLPLIPPSRSSGGKGGQGRGGQ